MEFKMKRFEKALEVSKIANIHYFEFTNEYEYSVIKNMLENRPLSTDFCSVSCGTIHSFQGDECDIMFIVLNPPALCSAGSHVNNENIINVAKRNQVGIVSLYYNMRKAAKERPDRNHWSSLHLT